MFVLQRQRHSRVPSTGIAVHQINDQPSAPIFEDFTIYTQEWLSCAFLLDMTNLMM